jgi:ribosomal subunit interface protein
MYSIKTTNFEMTPDVQAYLDEKLATLDKYIEKDDESVKCDVEIGKTTEHHQSGSIFMVEVNVSLGKKLLRAVANEESVFAAIDAVKDEISKSLRRNKDKELSMLRRGGAKIKEFLRFGRRG